VAPRSGGRVIRSTEKIDLNALVKSFRPEG